MMRNSSHTTSHFITDFLSSSLLVGSLKAGRTVLKPAAVETELAKLSVCKLLLMASSMMLITDSALILSRPWSKRAITFPAQQNGWLNRLDR